MAQLQSCTAAQGLELGTQAQEIVRLQQLVSEQQATAVAANKHAQGIEQKLAQDVASLQVVVGNMIILIVYRSSSLIIRG